MYAMKENGTKTQVMRYDCLKAKDGTCYIVWKVLKDSVIANLLLPVPSRPFTAGGETVTPSKSWDVGKEVVLTEAEVNQCIWF